MKNLSHLPPLLTHLSYCNLSIIIQAANQTTSKNIESYNLVQILFFIVKIVLLLNIWVILQATSPSSSFNLKVIVLVV